MYCPNCGSQNTQKADEHPNGGELYVAEGMEGCDEFYDEATPYDCDDCTQRFYIGAK